MGGQSIDIDAGLGEFREHLLAIAAIGGQDRAELVVRSASAFKVASGMVFTVNGAASP